MNNEININKNTRLYSYQNEALTKLKTKNGLAIVAGRRVGKTFFNLQVIIDFVMTFNQHKNPSVLVVARTSDQVKSLFVEKIREVFSETAGYIETNSSISGMSRILIKRSWFGDYCTIKFLGEGSIETTRGEEQDLVFLDEFASYRKNVYEVVNPQLDSTDGKMIVTSTSKGKLNHFYKLFSVFKALDNKEALFFDIKMLRNAKWLEQKRKEYELLGKLEEFDQEYRSELFSEVTSKTNPFQLNVAYSVLPRTPLKVFVSVDIGSIGNCPHIVFTENTIDGGYIVLDYFDDLSIKDALDKVAKTYNEVHLVYPSDVGHPSLTDGISNLQIIEEYKQNYRNVFINVLNKTKNKKELIHRGIKQFDELTFLTNSSGIETFLSKLSKVELTDAGHFKKNGSDHCADALCYLAAFLDNDLQYIKIKEEFGKLGKIYYKTVVPWYDKRINKEGN